MVQLDHKTLKKLTHLCRLHCTPEEEENLLSSLKNILDYIEQLKEVDTEGVPPCNHVLEGMVNIMRDDVVEPTLPREAFLSNAPAHVGGMVRVPPVLKQQ